VRREEPFAPRHESGCGQADVGEVARRLKIPTGFHIANAIGVEATTELMRETGHQDVSCQMPHAYTTNPARTASENTTSGLGQLIHARVEHDAGRGYARSVRG
jgi:hypothetical protein